MRCVEGDDVGQGFDRRLVALAGQKGGQAGFELAREHA